MKSSFNICVIANGFTLIELTIILAILFITLTISIPTLFFLNQQVVSSDAEKFSNTLFYLQQTAISNNKQTLLKFDLNNNRYSFEDKVEQFSKNVRFGTLTNSLGSPSSQSKIISSPISFIHNQIIFYPTGKIQPGSIYLVDNYGNYMYAITVPVSQISYIRKYKFNNEWILDNS